MFQSTCSVWDATRPAARWRWAWAGFNPRAPYGARLPSTVSFRVPPVFQSTRPVRGRDLSARPVPVRHVVSIHAPRAGRDFAGWFWLMGYHAFQSTRPVRGATTLRECRRNRILVSIHAPRAGRDFRKADFAWGISVSIHAPRAGRDLDAPCHRHEHQRFQSTRPVRGATRRTCIVGNSARGFNPRAPCGARPIWVQVLLSCCVFQSTRPVRGATFLAFSSRPICSRFQSTRPVRGATVHLHRVRQLGQVSIHAPRAGRDGTVHDVSHEDQPVSIHAPRAGRDVGEAQRLCGVPVSIHAPRAGRDARGRGHEARRHPVSIHAPRAGRDLRGAQGRQGQHVSIHAPRAGRDRGVRAKRRAGTKFQSTRPVRGATAAPGPTPPTCRSFNPRAPCGARRRSPRCRARGCRFNPRAPCGARRARFPRASSGSSFNPRAPCGARPGREGPGGRADAVSIHAPRAGRDRVGALGRPRHRVSIHAPRAGRDADHNG